jgi:hypothetical protein
MANGKTFDIDPATPGVFKALDPVGREDQVEVEGAILKLDEVPPAFDFG